MYYVKRAIYGPDPKEQKQKCNALIRKNQREIDKQLTSLNSLEIKSKSMIKAAAKRNDMKSARMLAKEVYNIKGQRSRLHKSKAQLNSVSLQVNEAFAIQKLEGSMKSSTGLMKEVNSLVRLPELMGTMSELSRELMKSGIIDEMVTDTLDTMDEAEFLEDSEAEEEVNAILDEIIGGKVQQAGQVPTKLPQQLEQPVLEEPDEEDDEHNEALLDSMRQRLKALQS
ncbi:ESCRT-III subunit protein VPS24 [Sugiyamaella lignohabitans]|uniref:ESCRT-III subunit protein VPS24 n=1 Tax=Sugiyamaella lignohabitans TaxID=796027 RepID=A0A167DRS0_9ASCO|nr:ESCRT-III subunit protein VPS24 [Sugiyamaella lignohabitans]ANB13214.1 ESCRT-III subunit protein VPS24 [Sugiyamaella lignohabitans]